MTRGIRNNNPLNIRRSATPWVGLRKVQTDAAFCQFETMLYGCRAALINMRTHYNRGAKTLARLISIWAPPSENNTLKYIDYVEKHAHVERHAPLLPFSSSYEARSLWVSIASSMAVVESGGGPMDWYAKFDAAYNML